MGISFATDNKDFISFLYYVLSLCVQSIAFGVSTFYIWRVDSRQRKKDAKKRESRQAFEDERREEEEKKQRLQEWGKFSGELNLKYIDFTRNEVIQRLEHANNSFKVWISPNINGLDLLRYMINDEDSFPSDIVDGCSGGTPTFKPTALGKLRSDLRRVFILLNDCWSLCLLGEITENFTHGMQQIVIELGKLALPFCSDESDGHRLRIIKECLENFGENFPILQQRGREELTDEIPYVKFLRYEPDIKKTGKIFSFETDHKLWSQEVKFFEKLNFDLVESNSADDYALRFAKKMKEMKNEWIWENATDEEMVLKLIHDVRCITWKTKNPPLDTEDEDLRKALKAVSECKEVLPILSQQEKVKRLIMDFKPDLEFHENNGYKNLEALKKLVSDLQAELQRTTFVIVNTRVCK